MTQIPNRTSVQINMQPQQPSNAGKSIGQSCKTLICFIFVVGAILNIILTTILFFGVENYHKADYVKIYQVFESPKYAQTNDILGKQQFVVLYGQPQSGIINFIEHQANIRTTEGVPVIMRELEENIIMKQVKETRHYFEIYLGKLGRAKHTWFIILNNTDTPQNEIKSLQTKYPLDSIILISHQKLNIENFTNHKFPVLTTNDLKQFMQKDLQMDKKQIKIILKNANSKSASAIFESYKQHQQEKIRAAQQAQRKLQQQLRLKEQEQKRKLEQQARLAEQKSKQEVQQKTKCKNKKKCKNNKNNKDNNEQEIEQNQNKKSKKSKKDQNKNNKKAEQQIQQQKQIPQIEQKQAKGNKKSNKKNSRQDNIEQLQQPKQQKSKKQKKSQNIARQAKNKKNKKQFQQTNVEQNKQNQPTVQQTKQSKSKKTKKSKANPPVQPIPESAKTVQNFVQNSQTQTITQVPLNPTPQTNQQESIESIGQQQQISVTNENIKITQL